MHSGGEVVTFTSELGWAERLITAEIDALGRDADGQDHNPTVRVHVEASAKPFDSGGMRVITRGTYSGAGRVVAVNAGGSGFDMCVSVDGGLLDIVARYRPPLNERLANSALSVRFGLLASQILVHYPVLWRAGWRGRVPLHASVLQTRTGTPLLAGPGGVGKSRLVAAAIAAGGTATADNLCCADATGCFGLVEPLRTHQPGARAARTSYGRVSVPFGRRERVLAPDRLIVLERGSTGTTTVTDIDPADAARALIAGTYAAGELRRYWAFAATLALATGQGPGHPRIDDVAMAIARTVPCVRICVADGDHVSADQLVRADTTVADAHRPIEKGRL